MVVDVEVTTTEPPASEVRSDEPPATDADNELRLVTSVSVTGGQTAVLASSGDPTDAVELSAVKSGELSDICTSATVWEAPNVSVKGSVADCVRAALALASDPDIPDDVRVDRSPVALTGGSDVGAKSEKCSVN